MSTASTKATSQVTGQVTDQVTPPVPDLVPLTRTLNPSSSPNPKNKGFLIPDSKTNPLQGPTSDPNTSTHIPTPPKFKTPKPGLRRVRNADKGIDWLIKSTISYLTRAIDYREDLPTLGDQADKLTRSVLTLAGLVQGRHTECNRSLRSAAKNKDDLRSQELAKTRTKRLTEALSMLDSHPKA